MTKIADYTIESVIGTGGMGRVLKGVDPYGRHVAIKEILPEFVNDHEYRSRIDREIRVMQKLKDPNVVDIFDHFEDGEHLYIVMELVDGLNLEQYVEKNGMLDLPAAARIMHSLLGTMQYVHKKGVIHRDLKPGNVMIRSNGEVCVLDFGIAKDNSSRTDYDDERTQLGAVLGTDGYMSPEQANGYNIDHRSDIYSLGCVMFYLLTGRHAYVTYTNDGERTAAEIITKPFPRLSQFRSDLPGSVQEVLDKATDKNMLRRYASCRDFSLDITSKCESGEQQQTNPAENVTVTVGRENCDLLVPTSFSKVSRHHCDIEMRCSTGSRYFRITDHSANGTIVNGRVLHKGEYADVRITETPTVIVSADPAFELDWDTVRQAIDARASGMTPPPMQIKNRQSAGTQSDVWNPEGKTKSPIGQIYPQPQWPEPSRGMSFVEAVKSCFNKYAYFRGRASRSEYWFFYLFNVIVFTVLYVLAIVSAFNGATGFAQFLGFILAIYSLATILPGIAVTVRRLHDTDRSGWNILLGIIPIVLLIFLVSEGTNGPNQYGNKP